MSPEISSKLHETRTRYQELVAESQKAVTPQPEAFLHALNAFQDAGYSLRELLHKMKGYNWWEWQPQDEQDFITFMDEQRGLAVHHQGAPEIFLEWGELVLVDSPGIQRSHPGYYSQSFGPLGMQPLQANRRIYRFKANGENVVVCCTRYLGLLEKLVQAFP